jgi:hypothetical protein
MSSAFRLVRRLLGFRGVGDASVDPDFELRYVEPIAASADSQLRARILSTLGGRPRVKEDRASGLLGEQTRREALNVPKADLTGILVIEGNLRSIDDRIAIQNLLCAAGCAFTALDIRGERGRATYWTPDMAQGPAETWVDLLYLPLSENDAPLPDLLSYANDARASTRHVTKERWTGPED